MTKGYFIKRDGRLVCVWEDGFETIVTRDDEDDPAPGEGWERVERDIDPDDDSSHAHYTWRRKARVG
jgi:hypothetical protein